MAIIREDNGNYRKACAERTERKFNDPDLAFEDQRVYVLDEHEYFDPRTSTKGRHMMQGPSVITVSTAHGGMVTDEYHVNDPTVWAWIRRCIAEGHLNADNISKDTINNEREVKVA
jgi:hypothetical protein